MRVAHTVGGASSEGLRHIVGRIRAAYSFMSSAVLLSHAPRVRSRYTRTAQPLAAFRMLRLWRQSTLMEDTVAFRYLNN